MDKTRYCNSKIYFDDLYNPCLYVFWCGRNVWPTWFKYVLLHSKLFNARPHCNELWVIQYVHFGEICTPSGLIWKSACQTDSYGSLHAKQMVHRMAAESTYKVEYCKSREGQSLGSGTGLSSLYTDFMTEVKKILKRMLMEESKKRNRQWPSDRQETRVSD